MVGTQKYGLILVRVGYPELKKTGQGWGKLDRCVKCDTKIRFIVLFVSLLALSQSETIEIVLFI